MAITTVLASPLLLMVSTETQHSHQQCPSDRPNKASRVAIQQPASKSSPSLPQLTADFLVHVLKIAVIFEQELKVRDAMMF
jgi:hypothetical protein